MTPGSLPTTSLASPIHQSNEQTARPHSGLKEDWKRELLHSYTTVTDLLENDLITAAEAKNLKKIGDQFKIRITPYYAGLIKKSPDCPIRKQAIPHLDETDPILPEWATQLSQQIYGRPTPWDTDPIGDNRLLVSPRLTHRYENRAILHLSSMCAVYCRFCFRKVQLNDEERTLYEGSLDPAFKYLKENKNIRELILTGGDPLSVPDAVLNTIFQRIALIPSVKVVRIHSRMTVTLPSRFTSSLLEILSRPWGFQIYLTSHFNHTDELTHVARATLLQLKRTGVTLLNQSVLLKGINSSLEGLAHLFQELYEVGVVPFYLHHPDWTPGTFHFRMSVEEGRELVSALKGKLAGPALPDYILDIPQGYGKTSLLGSSLKKLMDLPEFPAESSNIKGALYEVSSPVTRSSQPSKFLYLDLF